MTNRVVQYFTIVTGHTLQAEKNIKKILHGKIQKLTEVSTIEESDVILVFCPVVSRLESDIRAALCRTDEIPDVIPVILVVLHYTFDPELLVPDSSAYVTRDNTITVDCLFHEDKGLLKCLKNETELEKITEWLKRKGSENPEEEIKRLKIENTRLKRELTTKDKLLSQLNKFETLEKEINVVSAKLEKITALQEEHNAKLTTDEQVLEAIAQELKDTTQCVSKLQTGVKSVRQEVLTQTSVKEKTKYPLRKVHSMEAVPPYMSEEPCSVNPRKKDNTQLDPSTMAEKSFSPESSGPTSELRLVLLGRTGCGRSAAGDTILGLEVGVSTVRQQSGSRQGEVAGRQVTVVDTPDWFCPELSLEELRQDVGICVRLSVPGPHAFLLVISVTPSAGEEGGMVEKLEEMFGERCWRNTMILFTVTDEIQEKSIKEFVQSGKQEIQRLLMKCGNRFHCLNVKERGDDSQRAELLEKIERMVEENRGKFYSSEIYLETESQIRAMETKIIMEREERRVRKEREMKEKLEKEVQNSLRKIEGTIQEHEGDIRQLKVQTTELEKNMKEVKDEEKKRELEMEVKRAVERRTEMEEKVKRLKEKREKEKREMEERHRQEMEEIREMYEGEARVEAERNLMKILMPELQRNILASKSKMQEEFSRQMEEKDRELELLRKNLSELTVVQEQVHETPLQGSSESERIVPRRRGFLELFGWFLRR